ncbi:MAG: diacylglycerol kinase [Pseudomonadota bacterium]
MTAGNGLPPPKNVRPFWAHPFAAFAFSMAGLGFLLGQRAAQIQLVFLAITVVVFALIGASLSQWLVMVALFMACLATEALNTAIELLVDRVSPEISDFAKHAKDLGSFAVCCALLIFGGYGLRVVAEIMLLR